MEASGYDFPMLLAQKPIVLVDDTKQYVHTFKLWLETVTRNVLTTTQGFL
jgi:hypothetical protein